MSENAESLTISSKTCNHLNLVKLQKNKSDNTITLDIISTNCNVFPHKTKRCAKHFDAASEARKNLFRFTFRHQLSVSNSPLTPHDASVQGIQVLSLFWIILLNVTTVLSYASSKIINHQIRC